MIAIIVLLSTMFLSCSSSLEQRALEAALDSEVVKGELTKIAIEEEVVFKDISKICTSKSYKVLFDEDTVEVECNRAVLDSIKNHNFNKSNRMLFLISIVKLERMKYEVNITHPNSGLLITTNVNMSKGEILIENSKVYSM